MTRNWRQPEWQAAVVNVSRVLIPLLLVTCIAVAGDRQK